MGVLVGLLSEILGVLAGFLSEMGVSAPRLMLGVQSIYNSI